jgi:hypothetical protein
MIGGKKPRNARMQKTERKKEKEKQVTREKF